MSQSKRKKVFPLYIAPFEHFMMTDDSREYPMTFFIDMKFTGTINREYFMEALKFSLDRHQILQATAEKAKKGRMCWVHKPDLMPKVYFSKIGEPYECPDGEFIDLSKEVGLRIWVQEGDGKVDIVMNFHHACVDGIGSHRFIGDLLAEYANLCTGPGSASVTELDDDLLKTRGRRQWLSGVLDSKNRGEWNSIKYAIYFAFRRARPLGIPGPRSKGLETKAPRFSLHFESLTQKEHKKLRDVAIGKGVTINDLLVAQIFLTMMDWNKLHPKRGFRKRLRLLMPTSLRSRGDDIMPAGNMTSFNFINRLEKDCADRTSLVKGIRDETSQIKQRGLGVIFIEVLNMAMHRKWALPLLLGKRCMSSIVLSNVGDPTRRYTATLPRKKGKVICGDLTLEDIAGSPPLRSETHLSIAITTYQRKLCVSFRTDPYYFDVESSKKILKMFVDSLRSWIPKEDQEPENAQANQDPQMEAISQ